MTLNRVTPLGLACSYNNPNVGMPKIASFISRNDSSSRKTFVSFSFSLLMENCEGARKENVPRISTSTYLVKFFLQKDAHINNRDDFGRTPLMYAIKEKKLDNVKLLLNEGADVEEKDNEGDTTRF